MKNKIRIASILVMLGVVITTTQVYGQNELNEASELSSSLVLTKNQLDQSVSPPQFTVHPGQYNQKTASCEDNGAAVDGYEFPQTDAKNIHIFINAPVGSQSWTVGAFNNGTNPVVNHLTIDFETVVSIQ